MQEGDSLKREKRIRVETIKGNSSNEEVILETYARYYNITSLTQRSRRQQLRNLQYDVKVVAQGHTRKLLRLTNTLPDVNKFHEVQKNTDDTCTKIAWDDLTGMKLDAGKVKEARAKELEYVKQWGVWTKIPRSVAHAKGWKVIRTRWIDVNKGDDENPQEPTSGKGV